jgi:hypothetical protein
VKAPCPARKKKTPALNQQAKQDTHYQEVKKKKKDSPTAPPADQPTDAAEEKDARASNAEVVPQKKTGPHDTPQLGNLEADLLKQLKEEEQKKGLQGNKELNEENIRSAWKAYADTVEQASYRSFLRKAEVNLEGEVINVKVGSELALSNIQQDGAILENIRKEFGVQQLVLKAVVDESKRKKPAEKPKRLLSPKEKYLAMRETNPLLQEMQRRFDLRPDE